jgi:hypothetical protein
MTNSSRSESRSEYSIHSSDADGSARIGWLKNHRSSSARARPESHAVETEPQLDGFGVECGESSDRIDAESFEK